MTATYIFPTPCILMIIRDSRYLIPKDVFPSFFFFTSACRMHTCTLSGRGVSARRTYVSSKIGWKDSQSEKNRLSLGIRLSSRQFPPASDDHCGLLETCYSGILFFEQTPLYPPITISLDAPIDSCLPRNLQWRYSLAFLVERLKLSFPATAVHGNSWRL